MVGASGADRTLRRLLWLGIALRLAVGVCLAPANNDPHLEFLTFMEQQGRLPHGGEIYISFHPPGYYLLASPLWLATGSAKIVQLLSLVLSIANLWLIHGFLRSTPLLETDRGRVHAMALAALLPQFLLFSGFVSNDSLAFVIGTGLLVLALRFIEAPSTQRVCGLALLAGLGLLTKGTSIAFLPLLGGLVVWVGLRQRWSLGRHCANAVCFAVIAGGLGCYKFVENYQHFGTPILSADEIPQGAWLERQQGTWQGLGTLVDVDVTELVREPELSAATKSSIPLLFYGTFWYSHIRESNFDHTRDGPWDWMPRTIYAVAVVPTLLMALGLVLALARAVGALRVFGGDGPAFQRSLAIAVLLAALLGQFVLVMMWGLKHDAWSFFQARLVFAAFPTLCLLLGWGVEAAGAGRPGLARATSLVMTLLWTVTTSYLVVEMAFELSGA